MIAKYLLRDQKVPDVVPANEFESRKHVAISSASLQSVWGRFCSMENGNQNWWSD